MTSRPGLLAALLVTATAGNAFALKPGKHADITQASCKSAGLPGDFCHRAATEDYNTDSREWDDLAAHAQISDGTTACDSADKAAARVWQLGGELRGQLAAVAGHASSSDVGAAGAALGRAMHTLQDNCAHHGMPNPQHAWFSLEDFCEGTELSPDLQADAFTCAQAQTTAAMELVAEAVRQAGVAHGLGALSCPPAPPSSPKNNNTQRAICDDRFLPGPIDACSFLGRADDWDGIDRTWNNDVVTAALLDAFAAGLSGEPAPAPICGGNETVLSPAVSAPIVDVSGGTPSCIRAHVFCFGAADSGDNPFADDPEPSTAGGCSTTGGGSAAALLPVLMIVLTRRRRR